MVPFLAMLLMGIITVALAYSGKIALSNAVREGARTGASMPAVAGWGTSVTTRVSDTFTQADNNGLTVCAALYRFGVAGAVQSSIPVGGCGTEPPTPGGITSGCYVKVWAKKPSHLNWVLGASNVSLQAQSVAVYNRATPC